MEVFSALRRDCAVRPEPASGYAAAASEQSGDGETGTIDMRKSPNTPLGTVHRLAIDSQVLAGNLLGDPTLRVIDVYVPAGHDGRAFHCWSMS
jgi:hypothetical protein